jgi:hypothetical protein
LLKGTPFWTTGIESLPADYLNQLFVALPNHWDLGDLESSLERSTLGSGLHRQLQEWFDRRHGRTVHAPEPATQENASDFKILDVFNLRDVNSAFIKLVFLPAE